MSIHKGDSDGRCRPNIHLVFSSNRNMHTKNVASPLGYKPKAPPMPPRGFELIEMDDVSHI